MSNDTLLVIDGSSVFRPAYIVSPQDAVTTTLDRIRALANDYPHAAVAFDSGRTFRHDIDATYKAQRPETDGALWQLQDQVIDALEADGFPVWIAKGFEADDIIATAVQLAANVDPEGHVHIASADKDLLQLVSGHVFIKSLKDGVLLDAQWVLEHYGVGPEQMTDYLCLVGDKSDNVVGAHGIGPKKAAALLANGRTLAQVYEALDQGALSLHRSIAESLGEFRSRWTAVCELITLRTDVPIPFAEIAAERTPVDSTQEVPMAEDEGDVSAYYPDEPDEPDDDAGTPVPALVDAAKRHADTIRQHALPEPVVLPAPPPQEWGKQLDPRSMPEAAKLAGYMHQARLFSGYGSPQAALATIIAGRELGLQAVASLRGFHIIDGKQSLSADVMRALALRSGLAKYFRCIERTAERCVWETWRVGAPGPESLPFTIEQAKQAWTKDERAWKQSGWGRYPEDMLSARASSKLARLVYPDILFGLYSPEELRDQRADDDEAA